jgi:NADPH:quinone reductase-like Zn-dependent oxidoreductase
MTGVPATMSGVQLAGHGGPEMLVWRDDIPVPRPGAGEVLVKVLAAGVNMTDLNTRLGWYGGEGRAAGWAGELAFPRIQGADLCGRIVALGQGVEDLPQIRSTSCPSGPSLTGPSRNTA